MKKRGKLGLILDLCVVGFIIIIAVAILLPAMWPTPGPRRPSPCKRNLRRIGLAIRMYAADYDGFPPPPDVGITILYSKYIESKEFFRCPSVPRSAFVWPGKISYEYSRIQHAEDDPANMPIVWDNRKENHKGAGRNALFCDGHTEWVVEEAFQELMEEWEKEEK